ncbi:MAG: aminoacyl-tRNA hydrolase [Ignavibacteriales bacterium]|nr:aminoacyl-tRNA hydrolase [Ignavibacteriales bacterium]
MGKDNNRSIPDCSFDCRGSVDVSSNDHLLEHFHSSIDELLVICDDFQLPLGTLRFRARGSDGGHNGLASVIYHLQRDDFSRLRCGIGSTTMPDAKTLMAEFVLQKFSTDEQPTVQDMVDQAARACDAYVLHGITKTMNVFNQKPLSADDAEPTSN